MTRLEKCEILKDKGYTYDPNTGKIYGVYGKEITRTNRDGYLIIYGSINFKGNLLGHHFAWYMSGRDMDFIDLDHEDIDPLNNRISNLRIITKSQQNENKKSTKGYCWDNQRNKWKSRITVNKKQIDLGHFNTEEEARNAYLEAKKKYHNY